MDVEVDKALAERSAQKKAEREAVKQRVARLLDGGATRSEIIQRLGISSGYYYRLIAEIRGGKPVE